MARPAIITKQRCRVVLHASKATTPSRACNHANCSATSCSQASCNIANYNTATSLQRRKLQCLQCCELVTSRCRRPSLWSSRALCSTMASDGALSIFIRPTFIHKLSSIELSSDDSMPYVLSYCIHAPRRTIILRLHLAILQPSSYVLP